MNSSNKTSTQASRAESPTRHPAGFAIGGVRTVLRLEGLSVLAAAVTAYAGLHGSWWLFATLFLVPDISFLAYLVNPRTGAIAYNLLHSYAGPLTLLVAARFVPAFSLARVAIVWIAHIGFDRAAGYGLKYAVAFGDTHLGRIGPSAKMAKAQRG